MINFANLIKIYINKNGITQTEFAKRSLVERGRVNKILLGRILPNEIEIEKLQRFFENAEIKT